MKPIILYDGFFLHGYILQISYEFSLIIYALKFIYFPYGYTHNYLIKYFYDDTADNVGTYFLHYTKSNINQNDGVITGLLIITL